MCPYVAPDSESSTPATSITTTPLQSLSRSSSTTIVSTPTPTNTVSRLPSPSTPRLNLDRPLPPVPAGEGPDRPNMQRRPSLLDYIRTPPARITDPEAQATANTSPSPPSVTQRDFGRAGQEEVHDEQQQRQQQSPQQRQLSPPSQQQQPLPLHGWTQGWSLTGRGRNDPPSTASTVATSVTLVSNATETSDTRSESSFGHNADGSAVTPRIQYPTPPPRSQSLPRLLEIHARRENIELVDLQSRSQVVRFAEGDDVMAGHDVDQTPRAFNANEFRVPDIPPFRNPSTLRPGDRSAIYAVPASPLSPDPVTFRVGNEGRIDQSATTPEAGPSRARNLLYPPTRIEDEDSEEAIARASTEAQFSTQLREPRPDLFTRAEQDKCCVTT
ncbi:hypothetical protein BCR39DRAFT_561566 [Naematelia encephala]|uniref:Uncharacterized protein n=1 Tax=Naematelia encephala TaxID=71784 RepID=A0A1Y2AP85_9TREE|nr:hypothetical protein BCR39DRAFT_561566 [Naematelia encephala]